MSNPTTISDLIDIRIQSPEISRLKEWQTVQCEIIKGKILKLLFNEKNKIENSIAEEYHIVSQTYVEYESTENNDESILAVKNLVKFNSFEENSSENSNFTIFMRISTERMKSSWKDALNNAILTTESVAYQPELWPQIINPAAELDIQYLNRNQINISISHGTRIAASNVGNHPKISINVTNNNNSRNGDFISSKNMFYTLIMFDLDRKYDNSQISDQPFHGYLHWAVINVNANNCEKSSIFGEEVVPYEPPVPPIRSGLHRYIFLLFRQSDYLDDNQIQLFATDLIRRERFPYFEFAHIMNLGVPVGINGFYSAWEPDYCDQVHKQSNYVPPEQFRSLKQQLEFSTRERTIAIEKAKIDLYEDLCLSDILPALSSTADTSTLPSSISLRCVYEDGSGSVLEAKDGTIIPSMMLCRPPQVSYECRSSDAAETNYFTLVLSDPDCPSKLYPSLREFVHWLVVNIPEDRIQDGMEVLPYLPVAPPRGSGLHRFVFMLYRQHARLEDRQLIACKEYFQNRSGRHTNEFLSSLTMKRDVKDEPTQLLVPTPVAIEAFLSEWEEGQPNVYAAVGVDLPSSPFIKTRSWQQLEEGSHSPAVKSPLSVSSPSQRRSSYPLEVPASVPVSEPLLASVSTPPIAESVPNPMTSSTTIPTSVPVELSSTPITIPASLPTSATQTSSSVSNLVQTSVETDISPATAVDISQVSVPDHLPVEPTPTAVTVEAAVNASATVSDLDSVESTISATVTDVVPLTVPDDHSLVSSSIPVTVPDVVPVTVPDDHSSVPPVVTVPTPASYSSNAAQAPKKGPSYLVSTLPSSAPRNSAASQLPPRMGFFLAFSTSGDDCDSNSNSNSSSSKDEKVVLFSASQDGEGDKVSFNPSRDESLTCSRETIVTKHVSILQEKVDNSSGPTSTSSTSTSHASSKDIKLGPSSKSNLLSVDELCKRHGIKSTALFEGETLKKRFSTDFMFKDSYLWIDIHRKSLHWSKNSGDKENLKNSKYLSLCGPSSRPLSHSNLLGEMKGVVTKVTMNDKGTVMILHTASEEFLEIKAAQPKTSEMMKIVSTVMAL